MNEHQDDFEFAVETLDDVTGPQSLLWVFMLLAGAFVSVVYLGWWIAGDILHVEGAVALIIVHAVIAYLFASISIRHWEHRRLRGVLVSLREERP